MTQFKSNTMRIAGIVSALPDNHTTIYELGGKYFDKVFIETMQKTVGVENLYICRDEQCSGDLGYEAADKLLTRLEWDRQTIDALLFISQTPDYIIPPTSTELQHKLRLRNDIFVMDSNYGCAGFVMGLMIASQLIEARSCKRILLINAECHRRFISNEDREGALLFSDGASATAIEYSQDAKSACFLSYVDGQHTESICLGLYKTPTKLNKYGKEYSYMNGEDVTQFMLRHIPKTVKEIFQSSQRDQNEVSAFLFHQANRHMVKYLAKRMKLDLNKVPINIDKFANTSSVSIPLLICDKMKNLFMEKGESQTVLMSGFGSGFLLANAIIEVGQLKGGDIIFV